MKIGKYTTIHDTRFITTRELSKSDIIGADFDYHLSFQHFCNSDRTAQLITLTNPNKFLEYSIYYLLIYWNECIPANRSSHIFRLSYQGWCCDAVACTLLLS